LNIPESRIALTDRKSLRNVDLSAIDDYGPELITPLGIAYSVVLNKNYDFFSVSVNDIKVRLYGIRQMKVMDALLMSGFDTKKLIGFSGKSLRFYVNGKQHYYAGEFSSPSQIYVNSSVANIETTIRPGDKIEVIPAKDGATPAVRISDIVERSKDICVYFNGMKTDIFARYFVNNTEVTGDYIIGNSDSIEVERIKTIRDLYKLYKMDENLHQSFVNGSTVDLDLQLYDGLRIDVLKNDVSINFNKEYAAITISDEEIKKQEFLKVKVNNKIVSLPKRDDNTPYIFADMLIYTDIDPSNPKGNIVLLHNGKEASYLNFISDNDDIVIKWDSE